MNISALRSLFFSLALLPLPLAAARVTPLTVVVRQDSQVVFPQVWTGRVADKAGVKREEVLTDTYARDLRQKLAAVRVMVDVDRKLEEAAAASLELWIRATRTGYAERKEVLVEALLLRARILQALNRGPVAASELNNVFPVAPPDSLYELVPFTLEDRRVMAEVARDPRIVKAREALTNPREAASAQSSEDRIGSIVDDALERGDVALSMSLGERAVPSLVAKIETNLEEFPAQLRDPLFHLTATNTARAADVVAGAYTRGGPIWKARVLRLLNAGVFTDPGSAQGQFSNLWKPAQTERDPPTFSVPRWFDVLEMLLVDPTTKREAIQLVRTLAERNALTPGIQRALTAILMDPSTTLTGDVLSALSGSRPTTKSVHEAVLNSPSPTVRSSAAHALANWDRSDVLIAASNHTDPEVRKAVASSMNPHWQMIAKYPAGVGTELVRPKLTQSDRAVLAALAVDPEPTVRMAAATTIAKLPSPLDVSVYEKLARDDDWRVRWAVLEADSLPLEQRANLALAFAGDSNESVLQGLDQSLRKLGEVDRGDPVPDAWLPVLRARRANSVVPFERDDSPAKNIYDRLGNSTSGMRLLAEWITSDDSVLPQYAFLGHVGQLRNRSNRLLIDGTTLARVYRRIATTSENVRDLVRYLSSLDDAPATEFSSLAEDTTLDASARLGAVVVAARGKSPRAGSLFVTVLELGDAGLPPLSGLGGEYVKLITAELDDAQSKSVAEALLTSTKANASLGFSALNEIAKKRSLVSSESEQVLTRWLDDPAANYSGLVAAAVSEVGQRPRDKQGDWLVRAAHIANTCVAAFRYIGDSRDESYVELLRQAVIGPFDVSGQAKPDYKGAALNALTRYFDARAADIILEAAGSTPEGNFRDECFKALETIRRYEAEKGRVAKDRATQAATATAVRDLVAMLNDPSAPIRAQALRALATLGAVEEMPAIVRRLKDSDESVRKAAEAALDTLNAPPASK